jgi:hypothetical protein
MFGLFQLVPKLYTNAAQGLLDLLDDVSDIITALFALVGDVFTAIWGLITGNPIFIVVLAAVVIGMGFRYLPRLIKVLKRLF